MPARADRDTMRQRGRRAASRADRARILILCGGASERRYLTRLCRRLGITGATTIVEDALHPSGIVDRVLVEERRAMQSFDTVWAVFDKDDFADFEDLVRNGRRRARPTDHAGGDLGQRVGMAYSNPCFELWLALHFGPWSRPCGAAELDSALRGQPALSNYRHGDDVFETLDQRRPEAVANALGLEQRNAERCQPEGGNPSTAVHRLVQYLEHAAPVE